MKHRTKLAILALISVSLAPAAPARQDDASPDGLSAGDWSGIRAAYEAGRHAARPVEEGFRAHNPGQQWQTVFDGRGFTTEPDAGGWTWGLELRSYGFPGHERAVTGKAEVSAEGGRVAYDWDATLQEWYVNDTRGLEHGYTVHRRPHGEGGPLTFTLAVRGELRPEVSFDGRNAGFVDEDGVTVLTYAGLTVFDADGAELPVRLESLPGGLRLIVEEERGTYPLTIDPLAQQAYLKASNTDDGDYFGWTVSISGDTVAVGAYLEDSGATGVNGDQTDNSATWCGAVYVFVRNGTGWSQQAYLKASNAEAYDLFGHSVSISGDTLVVGASREDSNATAVNGDQTDNTGVDAGAAYVFVRNGTSWSQEAYLKASNAGFNDDFGRAVAVSGDTIVVGAPGEDSGATGVNGDGSDQSVSSSGAAYVFTRSGTTWSQQAYLKPSAVAVFGEWFGATVAVSGNTVVIGSPFEDSNATGIDGDASNDSMTDSGAAYVFTNDGAGWSQQAYLKASNTGANDYFGMSVSISGDTLAVGARTEDSGATGVNGDEGNNSLVDSGAAYVFVRTGTTWTQQAYLKASNTGANDWFGASVSVSDDTLVVGALFEDCSSTGVNGDRDNNNAADSGAAYVFSRSGTTWSQQAYLKASNTGFDDQFGWSAAVSGDTVVVGSFSEGSGATGVDGDQTDNSAPVSGAAYVFALPETRNILRFSGVVHSAGRRAPDSAFLLVDPGDDRLQPGLHVLPVDGRERLTLRVVGPAGTPAVLWIGTRRIQDGEHELVGRSVSKRTVMLDGTGTALVPLTLQQVRPDAPLFAQVAILDTDSAGGLTLSSVVELEHLLDF